MEQLRGKYRYEVDGKTVLFIPTEYVTDEQIRAIENREQVTFSAKNENSGEHAKPIGRSIMLPVSCQTVPNGYNVTLELDYTSLPVSRREIDGNSRIRAKMKY